MAVTAAKTWIAGEVLTAADLNSEFLNIYGNGQAIGFPRTASADFDGQELILDSDADTSITADTDDQIDFKVGGSDVLVLTATRLLLKGHDIGLASKRQADSASQRISALEARVNQLQSDGVLESQVLS